MGTIVAIKCHNIRPPIFLPTANWNVSLWQNHPDGQLFARRLAFFLRKSSAREKGLFWIFFFNHYFIHSNKMDLWLNYYGCFSFLFILHIFTFLIFRKKRKAAAKSEASEVISNSWRSRCTVQTMHFFSLSNLPYCL